MNKHGHKHGNPDDIPDPEKIKEILGVVSDKVPDLLKKLSDVLYGPDQARKYGRAAAVFYTELKKTGMSNEEVFQLTKQYMASLNVAGMFGEVIKHGGPHGHHGEDDDE